jgi:lysozyme
MVNFATRAALIGAGLFLLGYALRANIKSRVNVALGNANVRAFLDMIARFESGGRYDIIYGGGTFTSYASHPNVRIPFFNPATGKQDISTAAGRYQINKPTYNLIAPALGVSDFSPESQDEMAAGLLYLRGALDAVERGVFFTAIKAASGTWASLPMSESGQPKAAYQTALNEYLKKGGSIA